MLATFYGEIHPLANVLMMAAAVTETFTMSFTAITLAVMFIVKFMHQFH